MRTRTNWRFEVARALAAGAGVLAALAALHAVLSGPPPVPLYTAKMPLISMPLAMGLDQAPISWRTWTVDILALGVLMEAGLGLVLVRGAAKSASARQLMLTFCTGSLAWAWFAFLSASPVIRDWLLSPLACVALDAFAGTMAGYATGTFMRVFIWYPRLITEHEWVRDGAGSAKALRREYRFLTHPRTAWLLGAFTGLAPVTIYLRLLLLGDHAHADQLPLAVQWMRIAIGAAAQMPLLITPFLAIAGAYKALLRQGALGSEAERRQFGWIYWPFAALNSICLIGVAALLVWGVLEVTLPDATRGKQDMVAQFLDLVPLGLAVLYALVTMASLAISIFYHGAVDPKLAVGRISAWTVVVIALTVIFLVVERVVARSVVDFFGWSRDTGGIVAGAITAATFGPLRRRTERAVHLLADRWQPARPMEGQRVTRTICFVDISGYSAVSAMDEQRALLLAAVLLRRAQAACDAHEGRVVKSLGDAVICEFEEAANAIDAVRELEQSYAGACASVGIAPLPLHGGIHTGELMLTATGDVFGATVNLAARLQDLAGAGETFISAQALAAANLDRSRAESLGARTFKNIPEPVECYRLVDVQALAPAAAQTEVPRVAA